MGAGIIYVFARAGWAVQVVEPAPAQIEKLHQTLASAAADGIRRGKLSDTDAARITAAVHCVSDAAALPRRLDLAIETVPELPELKARVLRSLSGISIDLVATNTSSLSIDSLAGAVDDPSRFLGMHFFNPVWSLPLVEVITGDRTSEASVAAAREIAASLDKQAIVVRNVPGFATSRLDLIASLEAIRMLEQGVASAEDIDRAATLAYRHPIGPLRLSDVVGLDVRLDIARHLHQALGDRFEPPRLLVDKVARGELGRKTGKGFYDWT
jgi:3-hydroxybutyryl-CoA dehydrogenase